MSDTMRLVLLRHGESVWNKENLFTGWTDVDLSDKGREEARSAGRLMRDEGLDFDVCYTSFLKRAIHTLNLALEEMDREWLPVTKAWQLNERHYGALQGLNKADTAAKYGEEQVKIWRRSYATPPPELSADDEKKRMKAYAEDFFWHWRISKRDPRYVFRFIEAEDKYDIRSGKMVRKGAMIFIHVIQENGEEMHSDFYQSH